MAVQLHGAPGTPMLEVQLSGKLHRDDYEQLGPAVEKLIKEHGKIAVLVEMKDFHGWDAGALWEDIKFDMRHFNDIERVALVGDRKWERGMAAFCKPFTSAEVRFFEPHEIEEAKVWLRAIVVPGVE